MKNRTSILFSLALISFALSLPAFAQKKGWGFGPEAGVSISRYGQDAPSNDFKSGAIGGLFASYDIQNTFGITTKLLYSQKGASFDSGDSKQTLNYLEIPVIGRLFLNKEGNLRPNIFVGPSFGILRSVNNQPVDEERVEVPSYKPYFNTFDFGVTGGIGFNYKVAYDTYFVVDARYTHGLSDISTGAGAIYNQSFALTAGLSFFLGK